MSDNFDDVTARLNSLTKGELEKVIKTCTYLLVQKHMDVDYNKLQLLFSAVALKIYKTTGKATMRYTSQLPTNQLGKIKTALQVLDQWTDKYIDGKLRPAQRYRLYYWTAGLVTSHLQSQGVLVSLSTVLDGLQRAPEIASKQYPGYVESGLMYRVIRKVVAVENARENN